MEIKYRDFWSEVRKMGCNKICANNVDGHAGNEDVILFLRRIISCIIRYANMMLSLFSLQKKWKK